jgi:SAM-dependent methyltransferase
MVERIDPGEPEWTTHCAHHLARYAFAAELVRGRRVLDAGCGSGYGSRLLALAGAVSVVGVDSDPETVRRASRQFAGEGVRFLADDCQELSQLDGPLDAVCCFEALEHFAQPERFLAAVGRRLSDDGFLVVSTPDRAASPPQVNGRPRNEFHVTEWYRHEFRDMLGRYFAEVDLRAQVESAALRQRREAVEALRQGFLVTNPLLTFLWRKWPLGRRRHRAWKKLAGLAAASPADFPIVAFAASPLFGASMFHVAICRRPRISSGSLT